MRRLPYVMPLLALCAAGLAVAVSAAGTHSYLVPAERRGVRAWIDGPLRSLGVRTTVWAFIIEVAVMAAAYAVVLLVARRLTAPEVGLAIVTLVAIFTVAPPLLSTDVFDYVDYARLGIVHHLSPYEFFPSAAPQDVMYHFAHWRHTRSAYGPLFTLASYLTGYAAPVVALWIFKAASGIAVLGCVGLIARIAHRLGHSPAVSAAVFGLNPLVLVWAVGGGHNDPLMLLAVLCGVALVLERRDALGGAALLVAAAVKATGGLVIPFALLAPGAPRRRAIGVAAGLAIVLAVSFVAFPDHGAGLISVLRHEHRLVAQQSVPRELTRLFGVDLTASVRIALSVVLAVALAGLACFVWRGGDWLRASGWALIALTTTSTWLVPWYLIWPLPFAALGRDRRLLFATLILQTYVVVNFLAAVVR